MNTSTNAETVHFMVPLKPKGSLALVESPDHRLRIMRDGRPVPGCTWSAAELAESIRKFREMGAAMSHHN